MGRSVMMGLRTVIDARTTPFNEVVEEVARVVFSGGTVIYPSDTGYVIACDPYRGASVDRIYAAKGRADQRPLTLHVASATEFLEYARDNGLATLAAKRLFPGPVTLVIRRPAFISEELTAGLPVLGFRVPDDEFARTLLDRCGPLAVIGASIDGALPYAGDGQRSVLAEADLLIERGPTRYRQESSIIDLTGSHPRMLREGVVSASRIAELLGSVERHTVKVRKHI